MVTLPDGSRKIDQRRATETSVRMIADIVTKQGVAVVIAIGLTLFITYVVYDQGKQMNSTLTKHVEQYNRDQVRLAYMLRTMCANAATTEIAERRCYATAEEMAREVR